VTEDFTNCENECASASQRHNPDFDNDSRRLTRDDIENSCSMLSLRVTTDAGADASRLTTLQLSDLFARIWLQGSVVAPKGELVNLLAGFPVSNWRYAVVAGEIVVCVLEKTSVSLYASAR